MDKQQKVIKLHGFGELLEMLHNVSDNYDFDKIIRAYEYAKSLHEGQYRKSGEEYIYHPLAVAYIVAELELDTDSVCAALLHDTVEDCKEKTDIEIVKNLFGAEVAELVDGVTKLTDIPFESKEDESIENLRKMFFAMSKDIRVIFIKLADRLHNMRTLSVRSDVKRRSIALETMHVYAPLAHRLGMQRIMAELENLALMYLDPIGYDEVRNDIKHRYGENKDFLKSSQAQISDKLTEQKIKYSITGRVKSIYSIYKKMYNQNKSFEEIYDFYAIRIIVDTELECYTVLGIIHDMFNLMPGRFKDYISTPKPNMYRSLHTTVIGKHGIPFEVQIRTWEMHSVAEYGVAAHWKYKSGEKDKENLAEKLQWIRTLVEIEKEAGDADEFLRPLKIDIFEDETFVFTPKGDVINLPQGSNCIDFAFSIHTEVGNKMVGAKVNGMIVPIDTMLKTGQIVEVITSSASKGPSRDWLGIVKTSEAKNKIRQWFKREKRAENIVMGKAELEKEFRKFGRAYTEAQMAEVISNVAKRIGILDVEDFYNNIGYGGMSISKVFAKLKDEFDRIVKQPPESEKENQAVVAQRQRINEEKREKQKATGAMQSVIVDGTDNCQVRFAKCCNPLPGDDIVGFVTRGFGVSVHKNDCPNAISGRQNESEKNRWLDCHWSSSELSSGDNTKGNFEALLNIYSSNTIKVIADISNALNEMRIPVHAMNTKETAENILITNLTITCRNAKHVETIISKIKIINGVKDVTRGFS